MLNYYEPTVLEGWIWQFYLDNNIKAPVDITIENISQTLEIGITIAPNIDDEAMYDEEYSHVFINALHQTSKQKEIFLHELCHILKHYGDQRMLPATFRELQEIQAAHFQLYAALPIFMIKELKLPEYENDIIHLFATKFGVTHDLAHKRWEQIKRRCWQGQSHQEFVQHLQRQRRKADPANWCPEAKAMFRLAIQRKIQKGQGVIFR